MCDLWRHTLDDTVAPGDIPRQIRAALAALPAARHVKLYNAGSFFDPAAIPPEADDEIARVVAGFDRVIVESHPAFLAGVHGERCLRFRDLLRASAATSRGGDGASLELAVGLETAHPATLARLNKAMTIASFRRAAGFLAANGIALRVFVLVKPPFTSERDGVEWACRSIDLAIECGASVCSVIPTRAGNGAMEALGDAFTPPSIAALEAVIEYGLSRGRCRIFADLWDLERLKSADCFSSHAARLRAMNLEQRVPPPVPCACDDRL
jgi:radical SAM enzyme (TIGR01210 family)